MSNKAASAGIGVLLCLSACSDTPSGSSDFIAMSREGWAYGDVLEFNVAPHDTLARSGRVEVSVSHNTDYPYSNLWLEVSSGDVCDTVEVCLADDFGHWLGSGHGTSRRATVMLPHPIALRSAATPIKVRHIMRVDTIREIELVGVNLITQPRNATE